MSWSARRFNRTNWHHVPPRNPARTTPFKMRVNKIDHAAYHQLFANAATFEQCCEILWWHWWRPANALTIRDIAILHQMGISVKGGDHEQ